MKQFYDTVLDKEIIKDRLAFDKVFGSLSSNDVIKLEDFAEAFYGYVPDTMNKNIGYYKDLYNIKSLNSDAVNFEEFKSAYGKSGNDIHMALAQLISGTGNFAEAMDAIGLSIIKNKDSINIDNVDDIFKSIGRARISRYNADTELWTYHRKCF